MKKLLSFLSPGTLRDRAFRQVRRFAKARSGVAAVEFALMVPTMLSVWVGMVVVTDAIHADKKVTLLARTLADITTQMTVVSQADMDTVFQATESVMYPQPATALGMRVTAIDIDANGVAYVDWSVVPTNPALKGSFAAIAHCTKFTALPTGLKVPRTSIVFAEVTMDYQASVATQIVNELFKDSLNTNGAMPLSDSLYMRPRQSTKVTFNPATSVCSGFVP